MNKHVYDSLKVLSLQGKVEIPSFLTFQVSFRGWDCPLSRCVIYDELIHDCLLISYL